MPPVGVLTRLDDPDVLGREGRLVVLLRLLRLGLSRLGFFLRARLRRGGVVLISLVLLLALLLTSLLDLSLFDLDFLLDLEVEVLEAGELNVVEAILDMEGDRQVVEHVLVDGFVVVLHVQEQSLLVVHVEVVFDLVVELRLQQLRRDLLGLVTHLCRHGLLRSGLRLLFLVRLLLGSSQDGLVEGAARLDAGLLVREFGRQHVHDVSFLDLSPAEVAALHLFAVVLDPPVAVLEERPHHHGVVALADEVLVDDVGGWHRELVLHFHLGLLTLTGFLALRRVVAVRR
mmetsp:Transcript_29452/g.44617  ORF Transcript_29452/g.44617 Transcript_29452/m.44617 type:complete len:287 (-) Transcript_29452:3801-4661(-)